MEEQQAKAQKEAVESEFVNYTKLDRINDSEEFNAFFDLQIDTASQKIMSLFTGNGPKDWNEFCRIRGEVIGIIYPIVQIRGANVMKDQLKDQLNSYYNAKL